jgi:hypothetical protein
MSKIKKLRQRNHSRAMSEDGEIKSSDRPSLVKRENDRSSMFGSFLNRAEI